MPRRSTFAALAVVALVGGAGCWGGEDEASRCEPAPAWFLALLDRRGPVRMDDLWATARGETLGDSAAVQTSDSFKIPPTLRENAWFVSVDVRPEPGIETWVISDEAFRSTGLLGLSSEQLERGADVITSVPGSRSGFFGIRPDSDGLGESVTCVEEGLP